MGHLECRSKVISSWKPIKELLLPSRYSCRSFVDIIRENLRTKLFILALYDCSIFAILPFHCIDFYFLFLYV